jgi:hypothetical protein
MNIATGPQRPGQHGRVERMNARKTASIPKCTRSKIKECQGRTAKFSQKCMEVRESQTHGTSTRMSQIAILFIISRLIVRKEPLFTPPNCTFSGKRRDQVDAFLFLAFRRDQGSSASLLLKFFPAKGYHVWPFGNYSHGRIATRCNTLEHRSAYRLDGFDAGEGSGRRNKWFGTGACDVADRDTRAAGHPRQLIQ